jgi:alkanesulfonate monooxygenase
MKRHIRLNAFFMICVVHQSPGLWRHPRDQTQRYTDMAYWVDLARTLERGGFDALFLADVLGVYDVYGASGEAAIRGAVQIPVNDPVLLVPTLAYATRHLGFGVTSTLSYEQPYAFARHVDARPSDQGTRRLERRHRLSRQRRARGRSASAGQT